jgi:hypothetical protein
MRRARRIVNEMEFRMLRAAKSFSPSSRAGTVKGFSRPGPFVISITTAASASLQHCFAPAHVAFSKAIVR